MTPEDFSSGTRGTEPRRAEDRGSGAAPRGARPATTSGKLHIIGDVGKTACGRRVGGGVRVLPPRSSQHADCEQCKSAVRRSVGLLLNGRQLVALQCLAENTDPAPDDVAYDELPKRRVYAFQVEDALTGAGHRTSSRRQTRSTGGAANTLAALRKRGLVGKGLDGCFVQAQWWITPEGLKAHREATS